MEITMLTIVRALHILLAALWLGAGAMLTLFLMPTMRQIGVNGAPVMGGLGQRKIGHYMSAIAGLTALTGLWLYWHVTDGLKMDVMLSTPVLVLGIGVIAGLLAVVLAGAVLGRSLKGMGRAMGMASRLPDSDERNAHLAQLSMLQQRFALYSKVVVVLMITALVCMTLSHVL